MKRTIATGLALAMVLSLSTINAAYALDHSRSLNGTQLAQTDYGRDYGRDNGRSDQSYRYRGGEAALEGRWIASRNYGMPSGSNFRQADLPRRMVIDQSRNVVRVENFNGRVFQQIVIGNQVRKGMDRGNYVLGQWRGSSLLTVRNSGYDTRIIQTFALANGGRTLVVRTRQDARGTGNDIEFTNVYQRA